MSRKYHKAIRRINVPVTSNINNNVNIANIDNKNDKKIEEGYKDKANKSLSKHNNKKKKT